jgi:hypothetical protein
MVYDDKAGREALRAGSLAGIFSIAERLNKNYKWNYFLFPNPHSAI